MNAPAKTQDDRVHLTVPKGLEERWERVVQRVAYQLGCDVEHARPLAPAPIVSRGIEHLEKMG